MSEADHQRFIFDVLELNERKYPFLKWIYAVPNGGKRHPAVAAQLKAQGVKKGISDICIPIARDPWHGAYIELKDGNKKLTPEQMEFAEFLLTGKYGFWKALSCDEALQCIECYLQIKLQR
jgi:hypothetical protein